MSEATTIEGERFVLWLLDVCATAYPFPRALFEEAVIRAPTERIRESAAHSLRALGGK
jgi:hypothetical protein